MLVDMHPDVARMSWRYGRWHHYVDYSPFKKNMLKFRDDYTPVKGNNEYGLKLVSDEKYKLRNYGAKKNV